MAFMSHMAAVAQDKTSKRVQQLLGGPWDLVTTYNWAYNPTYNPPKWADRGYPSINMASIPVISSY